MIHFTDSQCVLCLVQHDNVSTCSTELPGKQIFTQHKTTLRLSECFTVDTPIFYLQFKYLSFNTVSI